jgi:DNA-binding Lrp family transcriptional regulator
MPGEQKVLDDIDRQIIELLAEDCRRSHRELARAIKMSPGALSQRVERLERAGVVRGYHAAIDASQLGLRMTVILGLEVDQGQTAIQTMEDLFAIAEVRSVSLITGKWDFVVELQVRDQAHLRETLLEHVWQVSGFRHSETMIVLERYARQASSWYPAHESQS